MEEHNQNELRKTKKKKDLKNVKMRRRDVGGILQASQKRTVVPDGE